MLRPASAGREHREPHAVVAASARLVGVGAARLPCLHWTALFAPAGTSPNIVKKLNTAVGKILHSPKIRQTLESQGAISGVGTSADMSALLNVEIAKWAQLIHVRNIKPD